MAQSNWTYADPLGQQFNIGLYHGTESGHVIVYCNKTIMLVDFSILETKQYSFYIGPEFFELKLEKDNDQTEGFNYELKVNKELNTTLNQIRKVSNLKNNIIAACLGLVFFLTIGITCFMIFSA